MTSVRERHTQGGDLEAVWMAVLQSFYEDLPESLRQEVARDAQFLDNIGVRVQTALVVNGLRFHPDEFWSAAEAAVSGQECSVRPIGTERDIVLKPPEGGAEQHAFCFVQPETGETDTVDWPELGLLSRSAAERESMLREHRSWFDCDNSAFEGIVAAIASAERPSQRMDMLKSHRDESADAYYGRLHQTFRSGGSLRFADMRPPSGRSLLRHFRMAANDGEAIAFCERMALAAEVLGAEQGLETAVTRFACFPVPLPDRLVQAISGLSVQERRKLLKRLLRGPATPLSRVHVLRLLATFRHDGPAYVRLARRLIRTAMGEAGRTEFEGFHTLLSWVNDDLSRWKESAEWPADLRLAMFWAHAHRLFSVFVGTGVDPAWVKDTFTLGQTRIPSDIFTRTPDSWFDVAHPRNMSHLPFCLSGLAYALGEAATEFFDEALLSLLVEKALVRSGDELLPVPDLLRDTSLGSNCLASFLPGVIAFTALITGSQSGGANGQMLHDRAVAQVKMLSDDPVNRSAWWVLHAVIRDMPLHQDMVVPLRNLMERTDFVGLFKRDTLCGTAAMVTAVSQFMHVAAPELASKLRASLLDIARFLATQRRDASQPSAGPGTGGSLDLPPLMAQWCLDLSASGQSPNAAVIEFRSFLDDLLKAWPAIGEAVKLAIQRFCLELPPSQAKHLWPLLLRIRAQQAILSK